MQQQILDKATSEQTRQALAGFGLNADELRQKLLSPATPITHIHLYHCDHLGTPQALIDPLGQVDWQIELDPWGNTRKEYNRLKLHQPIRMQGQHLDEASGLFYNRYRYYDPGLGRYISLDPIGLQGGINQFTYVEGDPSGYVDPVGLVRWGAVGTNALGMLGSGAGVLLGGALMAFPSGISQVLGTAVLSKSVYGVGTSAYGMARAFSDDASYDIPSKYQTLPRTVATSLSCSKNAERYADAAELALDLAAGKVPAGFKANPSGYLRSPVGYPPMDSSHFTSPATYSSISSERLNFMSGVLQGVKTFQYEIEAAK